jgi:hypothetical protein
MKGVWGQQMPHRKFVHARQLRARGGAGVRGRVNPSSSEAWCSTSLADHFAMVSCDSQAVTTKPPLCQQCAKTGKHSSKILGRSGTRHSR